MARTPSPDEARQAAVAAGEAQLDGAQVLAEVHATLTRYVVFPSDQAADAAVLYAAATHAMPRLEFAARLVIKSPVKALRQVALARRARPAGLPPAHHG